MAAKSYFRGHPIIWIGDPNDGRWVYADDGADLPATGGKTRPCKKCGALYGLGDGAVDPCLGILPGVDNACCGHGVPDDAYIRFTNGLVVKNFEISEGDFQKTGLKVIMNRIKWFCRLVFRPDFLGSRISIRTAWKVAGIRIFSKGACQTRRNYEFT